MRNPLKGIYRIYPINTHYITCIWGWLLRGTIPRVPPFSLWLTIPRYRRGLVGFWSQDLWLGEGYAGAVVGEMGKTCRFFCGFLMFDYDSFVCLSTPRKFNIDTQKWPYLKESIFSKASFWVSMLIFGGVNFLSLVTSRSWRKWDTAPPNVARSLAGQQPRVLPTTGRLGKKLHHWADWRRGGTCAVPGVHLVIWWLGITLLQHHGRFLQFYYSRG